MHKQKSCLPKAGNAASSSKNGKKLNYKPFEFSAIRQHCVLQFILDHSSNFMLRILDQPHQSDFSKIYTSKQTQYMPLFNQKMKSSYLGDLMTRLNYFKERWAGFKMISCKGSISSLPSSKLTFGLDGLAAFLK